MEETLVLTLDTIGIRLDQLKDGLAEIEEERRNLRKRIRALESVMVEMDEMEIEHKNKS